MNLYTIKYGLKRARKNAGLTQQELAGKMNVHIKTVRNWEQHQQDEDKVILPTTNTLIELTELYGCDLDYLTGRINYETHDLQFISEYTGLSEDTIKKLHSWNISDDRRKSWPSYITYIVDHKDFNDLMISINDFFASSKIEGLSLKYNDPHQAMDSINDQSARLWYISHGLTKILEGLAAKVRLKAIKRRS